MGNNIGSSMSSSIGSGIGSSEGSSIRSKLGSIIGSSIGCSIASSTGSNVRCNIGRNLGIGIGSSIGISTHIRCNRLHRGIPWATSTLYNKVVLCDCMCALGSPKLPDGFAKFFLQSVDLSVDIVRKILNFYMS